MEHVFESVGFLAISHPSLVGRQVTSSRFPVGHGEEVDVFVREDEVYICGQNRMENPTVDPAATSPDEASIAYLEVRTSHLCYLLLSLL